MLGLHLAVILFGVVGLFSKFLAVPAVVIVWGRTAFAVIASSCYLLLRREGLNLQSRSDGARLALQGIVLAFHWCAFFHSIQLSSVAIGLLSSFSTFPAFVLLGDAIFFGERITPRDIFAVLLILIGVALIVPEFGTASASGVIWGVLAGFSFAVLTLLNRKLSGNYGAAQISLVQSLVAALVLTPFVVGEVGDLTVRDWLLLAILGVFCTALAHTLFIRSLTRVRAFVSSVAVALEPVYGILAAFLILGEVPQPREIVGGVVIIAATIVIGLRKRADPEAPLL